MGIDVTEPFRIFRPALSLNNSSYEWQVGISVADAPRFVNLNRSPGVSSVTPSLGTNVHTYAQTYYFFVLYFDASIPIFVCEKANSSIALYVS
jgi:hypothetical protein